MWLDRRRMSGSYEQTNIIFYAGMQDLKAVITDKTSIRFGLSTPSHESNTAETFLSQELAINLLQVSELKKISSIFV